MKDNSEQRKDEEVQGIEVIDLGDAAVETRQGGALWEMLDSCCTWTYWGK